MMHVVDISLTTPEQNLACDEALLDMCEEGFDGEIVRFWEAREHFVVLGYSSNAANEINLEACRTHRIPVLRRYSGGGTVLQGPGCLSYSLLMKTTPSGPLSTITGTTSLIMSRHAAALQQLLPEKISVQGYSDLTIRGMKFSGNSQRRKLRFLLFHGTFLLDFDIQLVDPVLRMPPRQPAYRAQRANVNFLTNLHLSAKTVKDVLCSSWHASTPLPNFPEAATRHLSERRYASVSWTFRH